jgi:hypothetical protein
MEGIGSSALLTEPTQRSEKPAQAERWNVMPWLWELARQDPDHNTSDYREIQFVYDILTMHMAVPSPNVVPPTRLSVLGLPGEARAGSGFQSHLLRRPPRSTSVSVRSPGSKKEVRGSSVHQVAGHGTLPWDARAEDTGKEDRVAPRHHHISHQGPRELSTSVVNTQARFFEGARHNQGAAFTVEPTMSRPPSGIHSTAWDVLLTCIGPPPGLSCM